jgi:hypothetical protein
MGMSINNTAATNNLKSIQEGSQGHATTHGKLTDLCKNGISQNKANIQCTEPTGQGNNM